MSATTASRSPKPVTGGGAPCLSSSFKNDLHQPETMVDFSITGTVFLHGQPWKRGSEAALQAAGFTDEEKRHQVRCGAIDWHREGGGIDATDAAIQVAAESGVDLAEVQASIGGGRVGKPDVERFVKAQEASEA